MSHKARRATILLGGIPIDVYQLPNGSYELYSKTVTDAIEKRHGSFAEFLSGKSSEALPYKDFNYAEVMEVEVEGSNRPIKPIPPKIAYAYWRYHAPRNPLAAALVTACMEESVERRADIAFGVNRTETERQQRFADNFSQDAIAERELLDKQMELAAKRLEAARAEVEAQANFGKLTSLDIYQSIQNIAQRLVAEGNVASNMALSYELTMTAKKVPDLAEVAEQGKKLLSAHMVTPEIPQSPTELGEAIADSLALPKPYSAQKINKALELAGLQYLEVTVNSRTKKEEKTWLPTEAGKEYSEMLIDTARSNGKTVYKLRWFSAVVPMIEAHLD
ncbi:MAG TPA: hypothetical protein V6D12_06655 [Candidatus Obscuribacterales bacterium]